MSDDFGVSQDQLDSLRVTQGAFGAINYSVSYFCYRLDKGPLGTGLTGVKLMATALNLVNATNRDGGAPITIPQWGDPGDVVSVNFSTFCVSRELVPFPPYDAVVTCHYGLSPFLPSLKIGTLSERSTTQFDWTNRQLAPLHRSPIAVEYDPTHPFGPPGSNGRTQIGEASCWDQRSTFTFERFETQNPGPISRRFTARVNSSAWLGLAAGTVLCLSINGVSDDGGNYYRVSYDFLYDPLDLFTGISAWVDPETGNRPYLSYEQIQNQNGITFSQMQGTEEFNDLDITIPGIANGQTIGFVYGPGVGNLSPLSPPTRGGI